jgi:hypothetical protein
MLPLDFHVGKEATLCDCFHSIGNLKPPSGGACKHLGFFLAGGSGCFHSIALMQLA